MVSAGMVQGRSFSMVAGGQVMELRKKVSAVDGAGKEHCHGCWRLRDGIAVEGECGDGAGKEHFHGCWRSGDGVAVDGESGRWCWLLEVM